MCTRSRKWEIPAPTNVNPCNALHQGIRLSANAGGANTFIFMTRLPSACWPSWKEETRWNLFYLLCQVQASFLFSSSWKEELKTRWKLNLSLSPWPRCQLHADHWPTWRKGNQLKTRYFLFSQHGCHVPSGPTWNEETTWKLNLYSSSRPDCQLGKNENRKLKLDLSSWPRS